MDLSPDCAGTVEQTPAEEHRAKRSFRLLTRCVSLAAMVLLLAGIVAPWSWAPLIVPALSPYVLLASALAGRGVETGLFSGGAAWWSVYFSRVVLVGLPVLVFVLAWRRGFCRYACPVGLATEPLQRLCPSARGRFARLPQVGRWIVLATWAGAIFGYPLAIWLDPLAMFSGAFSLRHDPASAAGWAAVTALLLIAGSAVFWPNAWCLRVCPLGASQDLVFLGVRKAAWPARAFRRRTFSGNSTWQIPRRAILSLAAGGLAAGSGVAVAWRARAGAPHAGVPPIRPPGATGEGAFPWLCARCGNCVRACPEQILHPDRAPRRVVAYLTPVVRFDSSYCKKDCCRCTEVCPSGAIAPLTLQAKPNKPMGLARVDMRGCLLSPDNGERECGVCRSVCPYDAITMEFDWKTYVLSPRVESQKCPGCGACELACPGVNKEKQRKAILVVPSARERG